MHPSSLPSVLQLLNSESQARLLEASHTLRLSAKREITPDGLARGPALYLQKGLLFESLSKSAPVTLVLKPGEFISGSLVLAMNGPAASARFEVATPVELVSFSRELLREEILKNPLVVDLILGSLIRAGDYRRMMLSSIAVESVDVRILRLLWFLGETDSSTGIRKAPPLSNVALARCVGASREEVTRKLKGLFKTGLVTEQGEHYVLPPSTGFLLENAQIPPFD